jgi:hypothetical protein
MAERRTPNFSVLSQIACSQGRTAFREEWEHIVPHQVDGLCHRPNIATGFQAINAARKDRSHVTASQDFSFHQVF